MAYSTQEKTDILKELIAMAYADDHLKKEEVEFIKAIATRIEVDEQQLSNMMNNPDHEPVQPPKKFVKRIIHFHRLMLMMHIDGNVDDKELQLLHEVALRYGIRGRTVDKLLKTMEQYPHGEIPPSELLDIHSETSN